MGALSPEAIVLLVIIGSAAAVALCFAVSHLFHGHGPDENNNAVEEQRKYMREVRARNYGDFWRVAQVAQPTRRH